MYARPSKRQRRIKPIARIGAVDVTVRYDLVGMQKQRASGCSDECFDVMEGELLFSRNKSNFYRDNSLHVMSCLNGIKATQKNSAGEDVEQDPGLDFAGVAVTGFSPRTDVYEQGFVTQISGLCSVYNNSGEYIPAGAPVYAQYILDTGSSMNTNNPAGVPYRKRLVTLSKKGGQPIGTCVKGGGNKATIDIILHRCGADKLQFDEQVERPLRGAGEKTLNPPTRPFKPSRSKKSKSSK